MNTLDRLFCVWYMLLGEKKIAPPLHTERERQQASKDHFSIRKYIFGDFMYHSVIWSAYMFHTETFVNGKSFKLNALSMMFLYIPYFDLTSFILSNSVEMEFA